MGESIAIIALGTALVGALTLVGLVIRVALNDRGDRSDALVALANERAARTLDARKVAEADAAVATMKTALDAANARAVALEKETADASTVDPATGLDELRKLAAAGEPDVPAAAPGGGTRPAAGGHGG